MDGGPVQLNGDIRIRSVGVDDALAKSLLRLVEAVEAASRAWQRVLGLVERHEGAVRFLVGAAGASMLLLASSRVAMTIHKIRSGKKP